MTVSVLSSGSKGNTTFIQTNNTKILIDAGNTSKYILEKLNEINVDPTTIDAILITHTHIDHVKGLPVLLKKINPCVYITQKMLKELEYLENYSIINTDKIKIKDLDIDVIKTSHDTEDSVGYIVNNDDKSIVYITDTGYINQKYFNILSNRNVYIMESNHDIEMLNNSKYPFALRQRILSDKGHLSNYDSAKYISKFIGSKTKYVLLAHLSEENNTEELALETLDKRLKKEKIAIDNIIIAKQNQATDLINI
ncbi:MAG: MBL fold metallo-hydrolase [Erysipelotrichaceae bacterium]|nr:MBL fold metallo-hydrolase [Erysipelotrichaceae bacterium]MDY3934857.1 MBL fold metallo-hydrolase [Bacilli bacterium]